MQSYYRRRGESNTVRKSAWRDIAQSDLHQLGISAPLNSQWPNPTSFLFSIIPDYYMVSITKIYL